MSYNQVKLNTVIFKNNYWSSTTYNQNTGNAWFINFIGIVVGTDDKSNAYYVIPVRGGN